MTARLEAQGVDVDRDGITVLSRVTLSWDAGTLGVIVGPNGAGKSTLLDTLSGILTPRRGDVLLDGTALRTMPRRRIAQRVASVGQREDPDDDLTALEVVLLGRAPHLGPWGFPGAGDIERARTALSQLDASGLAGRGVATLSGGELQRVLLARLLCQGGEVMLADEPTAALDVRHALLVFQRFRGLAAAGATVVVTTHDLGLAARFATCVTLLSGGAVVAHGPWREALSADKLERAYALPLRIAEHEGQPVVISVVP